MLITTFSCAVLGCAECVFACLLAQMIFSFFSFFFGERACANDLKTQTFRAININRSRSLELFWITTIKTSAIVVAVTVVVEQWQQQTLTISANKSIHDHTSRAEKKTLEKTMKWIEMKQKTQWHRQQYHRRKKTTPAITIITYTLAPKITRN